MTSEDRKPFQPLRNSFHPAPKPSKQAHKPPVTPKETPKPKAPAKKAPAPKNKPKPSPRKKPAKKGPTAKERAAYKTARDRCATAGGFICEMCGGHIKEGSEHAHHIIYGRAHGARSAMTDPDLLSIIHGDFTEEQCHQKAHRKGVKKLSAFPFWRGDPKRFATLAT